MIKAVLDTNILVSAFLTKEGYSAKILESGIFEIIISNDILKEIKSVLDRFRIKRKYNFDDSDVELFLESLKKIAILTSGNLMVNDLDNRDPNDNIILSCALEGKAEYIVTRDNDILNLNPYRGINIVLPDHFYDLLIKDGNITIL